jgi:hypothetical protein
MVGFNNQIWDLTILSKHLKNTRIINTSQFAITIVEKFKPGSGI